MLLRLCVPCSHWLVARNWNFASSGLALTASSVANRVGVSTPLSGGRILLVAVVIGSPHLRRATLGHVAVTGGDVTTLGVALSSGVPAAFPGRSRAARRAVRCGRLFRRSSPRAWRDVIRLSELITWIGGR